LAGEHDIKELQLSLHQEASAPHHGQAIAIDGGGSAVILKLTRGISLNAYFGMRASISLAVRRRQGVVLSRDAPPAPPFFNKHYQQQLVLF